jgi:hypothetical protein
MALFRYFTEKNPYYIELHYEGMNYTKSPIHIFLTEKKDNEYEEVENLGKIDFDGEKAKQGYHFKSKEGDVEVKWVKKLLIISIMKVSLNGQNLKGSEIMNIDGALTGRYT